MNCWNCHDGKLRSQNSGKIYTDKGFYRAGPTMLYVKFVLYQQENLKKCSVEALLGQRLLSVASLYLEMLLHLKQEGYDKRKQETDSMCCQRYQCISNCKRMTSGNCRQTASERVARLWRQRTCVTQTNQQQPQYCKLDLLLLLNCVTVGRTSCEQQFQTSFRIEKKVFNSPYIDKQIKARFVTKQHIM